MLLYGEGPSYRHSFARPASVVAGERWGDRFLKPSAPRAAPVGLVELFVAVLIAGVSLVNTAVPAAAWGRLRDARFLLLAGANALFAALGAVWIWGELPGTSPGFTAVSLPVLLLALAVVVLLLAGSLWPRRP